MKNLMMILSLVTLPSLSAFAYPAEYPMPVFECKGRNSNGNGIDVGLSRSGPGVYEASVYEVTSGVPVFRRLVRNVKKLPSSISGEDSSIFRGSKFVIKISSAQDLSSAGWRSSPVEVRVRDSFYFRGTIVCRVPGQN